MFSLDKHSPIILGLTQKYELRVSFKVTIMFRHKENMLNIFYEQKGIFTKTLQPAEAVVRRCFLK